jgi:hypothetical protein
VRSKWSITSIPWGKKPWFAHHPEGVCVNHPKGLTVVFPNWLDALVYVLDSLREKRCVRRSK